MTNSIFERNENSNRAFSSVMAVANLQFSVTQYLKLLRHIEQNESLIKHSSCDAQPVCVPRAQLNGCIQMMGPRQWTVGFFPASLWQLINAWPIVFSAHQSASYQALLNSAQHYSEVLIDQAKRVDTHDLGMMIHTPLSQACKNKDVPDLVRKRYISALKQGEANLNSRFNADYGVIKSWDWPQCYHHKSTNSQTKAQTPSVEELPLAKPWQYPVIIDNLMNLTYLLKSSNSLVRERAHSHLAQTMKNHFHYQANDINQQRPIAYHVFDYHQMKPGNWQGLGNASAWSRGQSWALYGFTQGAILASQDCEHKTEVATYLQWADKMANTLDHLNPTGEVPKWDYFATRSDAKNVAENTEAEYCGYSHILNLHPKFLPKHILPYQGFSPLKIPLRLLSSQAIARLIELKGKAIVQGDFLYPCGMQEFELSGNEIPVDTSAAAIAASALYQLAGFVSDQEKAEKYEQQADDLMSALIKKYRTDVKRERSFELGFILNSATGSLPNGLEVDTPIVYADYFFIEANVQKLKLQNVRHSAHR